MDTAATAVGLNAWRECHDCGLMQQLPDLPDGEAAMCARCGALLRRAFAGSVNFARVAIVIAAALFALSLNLAFVNLHVMGRFATSTLFTGPQQLGERGLPVLAVVVLLTLIVVPAVKLAIELVVLLGSIAANPPRWLGWLFGWLEAVTPWAMIEVFLLGAIVAYTRLRDLARVDVGPALWALAGVMLATVSIEAVLDREALWSELERGSAGDDDRERDAAPAAGGDAAAPLIGCDVCRRVTRAAIGDRCPRCRHHLTHRTGSLPRVWALLFTAGLLYIPANVLPVMTIRRLGHGEPSTIINGVGELAAAHLWPLALLVLLASIIVPMAKLASMVVLLILTHRKSDARLKARTQLFRFVHVIGRWSMIDIFMLATLVGVVQLGFLATILPNLGAAAFCSVVLITMAATESFDPRVMWDAAAESGDGPVPVDAPLLESRPPPPLQTESAQSS
ncbi:MAG TPA: paraquat-inducible protein A [Polyangiaceae bacterium]|jgi:paraquat-inducible protein A|nr:paraquat-inducible protein A [Polyangiaceae bacterium]